MQTDVVKRRRVLIILAGLFVAAAAVVVSWPCNREPQYQGKKLSEWLDAGYSHLPNSPEERNAIFAVQQMGTNTLPYLLKAITYQPSAVEKRMASMTENWPYQLRSLAKERGEHRAYAAAEFGFRALGSVASPAIPQLVGLMAETNPVISVRAMRALSGVGKAGVAPLLEVFRNEKHPSRGAAVFWLAELYRNAGDPASVLPVLVECMKDKNHPPESPSKLSAPFQIQALISRTPPSN